MQFPALEAAKTELKKFMDRYGVDVKALDVEAKREMRRLVAEYDSERAIADAAVRASGQDGSDDSNSNGSVKGGGWTSPYAKDGHKAGEWLAEGIRRAGVQTKGWVTSGTTGGGAFTPVQHANTFWDRLAAQSVGLQSGFTVVTTQANELVIPRLTGDTGAAWTSEAAVITPTDATADEIHAIPKKLAALQVLSNEVIADSVPAVLDVSARQMIRSLALKLDLGFYEGSGTAPEIRGLKNTAGIQTLSMGTNGGAFTHLDPFADALGLLEEANAHGTAIVMHPRTWKALTKLKEAPTGSNKPLLQEHAGAGTDGVSRSIYGVPVYLSSQLSVAETQGTAVNASSVYVYQASEILAVLRQDTRVDVDNSRLFNSDQSEVRAIMRADVAVPNPLSVVRILGVTP
ncbi:phage major capsid protein [Streptomyces sp. B-S-A8]|uniref:Phage major capsid protein n=1 Tax=Streptomyces solicavernae TaxID=3043614 RepID=A0ABT6RPJ1_9ACTN|nr:phage major capsid protein [Streptomyces sp. B-S-A8]MDI3386356.1 phage major capsid protein [Streptomyces sp. B-S-A8]